MVVEEEVGEGCSLVVAATQTMTREPISWALLLLLRRMIKMRRMLRSETMLYRSGLSMQLLKVFGLTTMLMIMMATAVLSRASLFHYLEKLLCCCCCF